MRTYGVVVCFEPWSEPAWVVTLLRAGDTIEDWQARPTRPEQTVDAETLMKRTPVLDPADEAANPAPALATIRWSEWPADERDYEFLPPDYTDMDLLPQTDPLTDPDYVAWLVCQWLDHYERTHDAGVSRYCEDAWDVSGHHASFPVAGDTLTIWWRHLDGTYHDQPPTPASLLEYAEERAVAAAKLQREWEALGAQYEAEEAVEEETRNLLNERDGWFTPEGDWIPADQESS